MSDRPILSAPRAPTIPSAPRFRSDIQGLRAIAVILVVLSHASVPGFNGGYIGVDVFFVISGFVITGLLVRQRDAPLHKNLVVFYARRIRRIVPAATVVLVATIIATYYWLGKTTGVSLLTDVRWASLFAVNWHFIQTNSSYFIPGVLPSLVTHYWSLAIEEQFYIVFPLVVFSLGIVFAARRRVVLGCMLVIAIASSSWWSVHLTSINPTQAYYSPFTRFWELALGGLIALVPLAWAQRTKLFNALFGALALGVIIFAAIHLTDTSGYPGSLAWWPCGATAVLLYTGLTPIPGGPTSWLSWRPAQYVGNVSYGFYLWHYAWLMIPLQYATTSMSPWSRVAQIVGAFACAVLSYHFLENPIRHSKWLDEHPYAAGLLLIFCLAVTWGVTWAYQVL